MFGLDGLSLTKPQGISLVTSKGTHIENNQGTIHVAAGRVAAFRDRCGKRGWTLRRLPIGIYNCAGLIWASRRTGISQSGEWRKILRDDGYRPTRNPFYDDLAIYRDGDDNSYLHVARIVAFADGIAPSSPKIPIVLSKFGHDMGECYHQVHAHGLPADYNVVIEYWTERPTDEPTALAVTIAN